MSNTLAITDNLMIERVAESFKRLVTGRMIMVSEHFHNSGRFGPALFVGETICAWHPLIQHQARHSQSLTAFVVEKCVDVGNKFPDSGVQFQTLAQSGNQPACQRIAFIGVVPFIQTQRANPDMCRTRNRIGRFEGAMLVSRLKVVIGLVFHEPNLGELPKCFLS